MGESVPKPGPTGSTWAKERSGPRHAQRGSPSREAVGTFDPKIGFWLGTLFTCEPCRYGQALFCDRRSRVRGRGTSRTSPTWSWRSCAPSPQCLTTTSLPCAKHSVAVSDGCFLHATRDGHRDEGCAAQSFHCYCRCVPLCVLWLEFGWLRAQQVSYGVPHRERQLSCRNQRCESLFVALLGARFFFWYRAEP